MNENKMKNWYELHSEVMRDYALLPDVIPPDCEVTASTLKTRDGYIHFDDTNGMTFADAGEYCKEWGYTLGGEGKTYQCWIKPISFALIEPFRVLTLYRDIPEGGAA